MLSKIFIDLDFDNQPIIRIDYRHSEDVRDKMVKRFMESFGGKSTLATFFFSNTASEQSNTAASIRPLPIKEFEQHLTYFTTMIQEHKGEVPSFNG